MGPLERNRRLVCETFAQCLEVHDAVEHDGSLKTMFKDDGQFQKAVRATINKYLKAEITDSDVESKNKNLLWNESFIKSADNFGLSNSDERWAEETIWRLVSAE